MARRLAAIMFTDLAGYTQFAQADEAGALRLLQEQERLVRPVLETHQGRKVKSMGDGLLIEFPDALDAVECAVDLQRHVHEHNAREGARPLRMRVGIHLGDVQRRGTDILGNAVNIASRAEPLAEPGGVCLSEPVYVQIRGKVPYQLEKLGAKTLKGVGEPMEVYRVVLPWIAEGTASPGPVLPRIAVLPLANISPDPKDEYFADGLTEELISVLSQVKGLRVISHTSVNPYKGTKKPLAQIGSELGADTILEGSVRKAGDQLRIGVQLIDTRTDEHRWSQTYDRKLENVFAIQADVAERTASALKVELLKGERETLQERPTSSLVAYEYYLRGIEEARRSRLAGSKREEVGREAWRYFEEAIREDPQFAEAYACLADHLIRLMGDAIPRRDVVSRIHEVVAKALELNPGLSDAHTARGNLAMQLNHDWVRAEAELQQAIALNPSSSLAHFWYGKLLSILQRFNECKKQFRIAIELDPLEFANRFNLDWAHAFSGDLISAIASSEKTARSFRDSETVRVHRAWVYALAGRADDAIKLVEPLTGAPSLLIWWNRFGVLAYVGRPEGARAVLEEWEGGRLSGYLSLEDAAALYALLGEKDAALGLLERDLREGEVALWNYYQVPWFDTIRGDPRFVALLRAMNLPITLSRPLTSGIPGSRQTA